MSTPSPSPTSSDRELIINRIIDLPPQPLYKAWTEPDLLKQWFSTSPWTTPHAELDVRPGGSNFIIMRSPEGQEYPHPGVYLEVVPNRKLVITNAFTDAWEPNPNAAPLLTVIITLEDIGGGKTNYTARVLHWSAADREKHEAMGFYFGWNQCLDQLIELASKN